MGSELETSCNGNLVHANHRVGLREEKMEKEGIFWIPNALRRGRGSERPCETGVISYHDREVRTELEQERNISGRSKYRGDYMRKNQRWWGGEKVEARQGRHAWRRGWVCGDDGSEMGKEGWGLRGWGTRALNGERNEVGRIGGGRDRVGGKGGGTRRG